MGEIITGGTKPPTWCSWQVVAEPLILCANRKDVSVLPCCYVSCVLRYLEQAAEVMVLFALRVRTSPGKANLEIVTSSFCAIVWALNRTLERQRALRLC